jgi:RNA polymerase sigma-70 factor (ECF subfamily)
MRDADAQDERLSERVRSGDRQAFREMFLALHGPLVRYARSLTGDDEAAYDILQDTFLKLWTQREEFVPHTSLKAMLYTMVRNAALNERRNRLRRAELRSHPAFPSRHAAGSDADFAAQELAERIHSWIDELPERRAEAFRLSRHAGLSHREIARIMGVSERTVGTHILLALRHLRERLDTLEQSRKTSQ